MTTKQLLTSTGCAMLYGNCVLLFILLMIASKALGCEMPINKLPLKSARCPKKYWFWETK
jgi:hypothetical protein